MWFTPLQPGEEICSRGQKAKRTHLAGMAQEHEGQSLCSERLPPSQAAELWQGSDLSLIKIHS